MRGAEPIWLLLALIRYPKPRDRHPSIVACMNRLDMDDRKDGHFNYIRVTELLRALCLSVAQHDIHKATGLLADQAGKWATGWPTQ